jgi:hypothetical protein
MSSTKNENIKVGSVLCVTHGVGNFGRFARMISYDSNCFKSHSRSIEQFNTCNWHENASASKKVTVA